MKTGLLARLVVGCAIAGAASAVQAQSLDNPVLLIASPKAAGMYRQAVVVVVPRDGGHVGFIINRATRTTVAAAFPDELDSAKVSQPIYLGGPRAAQSLYAVVRHDPGEGSRQLFGDVFVTVSAKTVDRIIRESPHEARFLAGYTVWSAGELAAEVARGDWLTAQPEEALVFHPDPDAMWSGLVERFAIVTR
jgi:putative transcriptional regulator